MTKNLLKDEASLKVMKVVDDAFVPCTQYSYKLLFNPNDPSGVMKNGQETEVSFEGQGARVTTIEPITDDSRVGSFTASDNTLQDCIHLQWSLDTERMNKVSIEKYVGSWVELPINPNIQYFDDYSVEAGKPVNYRLKMEYECTDGMKYLSVDATGVRRPSGKIGGFVTFQDGTGVPDVEVQLLQDGAVVAMTRTDATGTYLFPDVMYSDKPYVVRISAPGVTDFDRVQLSLFLNKDAVNHLNQNFVSSGSFDVDGYVYFEQTTVPVYGATFLVDGQPVVDKGGNPILSDNDGHFAFKVAKGARRLEVRKEGHVFMFDGLYADNHGKAIELTENRTGIYFWDQTKVRTMGRVVGGNDEGEKPLGFGLSRNNLGDALRIVLELEGNQRSWLVKDPLNDALTVRYDTLVHEQTTDRLSNAVTTERHRIIISPNTMTGEYVADLLPTRYKVVEVSAQGYPSLFQKGKTAEVIDLSDSLTTKTLVHDGKRVDYRAIYNRIFRIEPSVGIVEVNTKTGEALPYVGDAVYVEPSTSGGQVSVPLYDTTTNTYTFGYPVLRTGQHNFRMIATENYHYNGIPTGVCDSVPVRGGRVRIYDDFASTQHDTLCVLNEHTGTADIQIDVANTVYDVTGTNALRHLDVTLEYEGQFIDGRNLQAFVMGYQKISDDVMSADGIIEVVDVLRDPPGSKSFSWVDSETTYQARFNFAIGANLSLAIGLKNGSGTDIMSGAFTGSPAGTWMGTQTSASTNWEISPKEIPLVGFELTHTGNVNFQLNERIQTSDDPAHVGDDADVYCGFELVASSNAVRNVRAINESTYQMLKEAGLFAESDGACHLITEGRSAQGLPFYLISDYNYQVGPKIKSNFVYTQDYILHTLLPKLKTMRNSYIYKGTREEAQAHATATRRNVFYSLRSEDDPRYGQDNLDEHFDYISIDRYEELRDRLNYEVIPPMYVDVLGLRKQMAQAAEITDSIRIMNRKIAQWEYVIARNEMEKLAAFEAIDAVQEERGDMDYEPGSPYDVADNAPFYVENHSISGGVMVNHSEVFSSDDDMDYSVPILGWDVTKWDEEQGMEYFNKIVSGGLSIAEDRANSQMGNLDWEKKWGSDPSVSVSYTTKNSQGKDVTHTRTLSGDALENMDKLQNLMKTMDGAKDVTVKTGGSYTKLTLEPNVGFTYESSNDEQESTRTYRGYQLETEGESHLSVDVYHDVQTVAQGINVFGATSGERTLSKGNYLFRTMGGATKCPYEGASTTKIFAPSTLLSAATAQVERPRISVEKHIVSNVPYGETAKFNLVLSNEGTIREEGSFDLVLLDRSNQQGASLVMDGAPLGNGRSLVVPFGTGMVKVLEVGQGLVDDYENIRLALRSQCDPAVADTVSLSVHYVPTASPINVITPQNQWVLNTNSAQDEQGRYYMPVSISGYDVNFRNFDHVELQYKQTTEPESRWTNLCSYYSTDSLYALGSGTKAMMSGGTITYAFYGDSDPVELQYDLRAVTYSRLGNDFVTRTSPVLSGMKDTRRPQLFGSPQPANGILGVGDDLKLVFSEDINANRLLASNNFRVTGTPNNSTDIQTGTSVMLSGGEDCYLESEAERNFDGESFTLDMMVKPAERDAFMSLFSHQAANGNSLVFSINGKTHVLRAEFTNGTTGEKTVNQSKPVDGVNWNMFQRVMMVFDTKENRVHFYVNSACVDNGDDWSPLHWDYAGNGRMVFGRGYQGNLLETRVWTKALTLDEINETGSKCLYGHEVNLCAYYPMNEGLGTTIEDKAQGATLSAYGTAWTTLSGKAIRLGREEVDARLTIKPFKQMNRGKSYTLSFWMNADTSNKGKNVGLLTPELATMKYYLRQGVGYTTLYLEDGHIALRRGWNDASMRTERSFCDGQWHHVALTVDRQQNQAVLYVDGEVAAREAADKTGHWNDDVVSLGRYYYYSSQHGVVESDRLQGYLDEITLWNSPLPENVIRQKMNEKLDGSEIGLLAYLPFSEDVPQTSGGAARQEFSDKYFFSQWDAELGEYVPRSESSYAKKHDTYEQSNTVCAPVKEKANETPLRFNFITKDNELIIELAESAKSIERTTVNITATGIEDMNGNEMEQPVIWSAFINRNMLRWAESKRHIEIDDDLEDNYTFAVDLNNHSGFARTFTIEGLPAWMTIEEGTEGRLEPTESATLHFVISKDINVGTYDDVIYLKNDEGLVDPLSITIRKFGHAPVWELDKNTLSNMQLCAEIVMGGQTVTDKENVIAAFDDEENCLGKGGVTTDKGGRSLLFLTIYGTEPGARLHFRMWDAQSDIIYALTPDKALTYTQDGIVGSYDKPVRMTTSLNITRELVLEPTWTWISLNVVSDLADNVNQLLKRGHWVKGDQLKDLEEQTFFSYDDGKWLYNGPTAIDTLRTDRMYCIKSQESQTLHIDGRPLMDAAERTITLHHDWNYIGYTPLVNLPVNEALSDFFAKASDGDIIKSQDEFATFSAKGGGWHGNLEYMKPGQGYMLYHQVTSARPDATVTFVYPFKSTAGITGTRARARRSADEGEPLWKNTKPTTMTMIVCAEGVDVEEGDRLLAYAQGELCGIAEADLTVADEPVFYLSVGGDRGEPLVFTLERDGQLIGTVTRSGIVYKANRIEGTTDVPRILDFSEDFSSFADGIYYTLSGIRVGSQRPKTRGIYIYNHQKVVIK